MTRKGAKDAERRDLDLLLELIPELGAPQVTPRESPDFELCFSDGRRVGLEVARVTDPSTNADGAAMRRVVDSLERALRSEKILLGVTIEFRANHWERATRTSISETVSKLVKLCSDVDRKGELPVTIVEDILEARDVAGVTELSAERVESAFVVWGETRKVSGALLTESCLSMKDEKLDDYRGKNPTLNTYWLVLVVGKGFAEPRWTEGSRFLANRTRFDRVFFLDVALRTAHELETALTPASA